jgi:hypothetical protein
MYNRCYAIGEYTTAVSEQRLGKHVPAEKNKHVNNIWVIVRQPPIAIIEELLKAVFSVGSTPGLYNENSGAAEWN